MSDDGLVIPIDGLNQEWLEGVYARHLRQLVERVLDELALPESARDTVQAAIVDAALAAVRETSAEIIATLEEHLLCEFPVHMDIGDSRSGDP